MVAGAGRVRVSFQVDADGLLSVSAQEKTTGAEASVTVKPSYGLADADIERMLRDSFEHAREDMHARVLHEHRVDAQRLMDATRSGLAEDGSLLNAEEKKAIEEKVSNLEKALATADARAIKVASDALNRATEEFAARRMNASVRSALTGKRVASLDA
jgi:molecular chaperone HscA